MSEEQFEFLMAIEEYKRLNAKPFPTWTEVLEVIKALGYHREKEVDTPLVSIETAPPRKEPKAKG